MLCLIFQWFIESCSYQIKSYFLEKFLQGIIGVLMRILYCFPKRIHTYCFKNIFHILARIGLMHIGVFILLLLSGERNFGMLLLIVQLIFTSYCTSKLSSLAPAEFHVLHHNYDQITVF